MVCMILFAITGITLNHAGAIESEPVTVTREAAMPAPLLADLRAAPSGLPAPAPRRWLEGALDISLAGRTPEWNDAELYIALPRAGGDGWVSVDLASGAVRSPISTICTRGGTPGLPGPGSSICLPAHASSSA